MAELKQNSCVADEQHNESAPRNSCVASSFPSLGAFRDGVLGKLSREDKSHGGLNLTGSDGRLLVVPSQTRSLLGELLEDVVDEAVHDAHGLAGDTDVGMNLLQHLEDVDLVAFSAAGFFSAGFFSALGAIGFGEKEREIES
nr:hypothetical protein Iba_chr01bCG13780 [Ipomoea batatas]